MIKLNLSTTFLNNKDARDFYSVLMDLVNEFNIDFNINCVNEDDVESFDEVDTVTHEPEEEQYPAPTNDIQFLDGEQFTNLTLGSSSFPVFYDENSDSNWLVVPVAEITEMDGNNNNIKFMLDNEEYDLVYSKSEFPMIKITFKDENNKYITLNANIRVSKYDDHINPLLIIGYNDKNLIKNFGEYENGSAITTHLSRE